MGRPTPNVRRIFEEQPDKEKISPFTLTATLIYPAAAAATDSSVDTRTRVSSLTED